MTVTPVRVAIDVSPQLLRDALVRALGAEEHVMLTDGMTDDGDVDVRVISAPTPPEENARISVVGPATDRRTYGLRRLHISTMPVDDIEQLVRAIRDFADSAELE